MVAEEIGTNQLPSVLVKALSVRFQVTKEDGSTLLPEGLSVQGLNAFLGQIASGVNPIPGFYGLTLLDIVWDRTVQLLHLLLSIPVSIYLTARWFFACLGELLYDGPPLVTEIPVEAFTLRYDVYAMTRSKNLSK